MGRQIPVNWDDVPDATLLPLGIYQMEVADIEETLTRENPRLMFKVTFKVAEGEFTGTPQFDYFVIGSIEDPEANKPETWTDSIGAKRLKRLAKATLVQLSSDIDGMLAAMKGQRFMATIGQEIDDGSKDPKYRGTKRNRITNMNPIGMVTATVAPSPSKPTTAPRPAAKAQTSLTVPCPYCGEPVARASYMAHIKSNHPEAE